MKMIDKPISRRLTSLVGEAHGALAVSIVLKELETIFDQFADEVERLYDDQPELDKYSGGYRFAAGWCHSWAEEVEKDNV